MGNMPWYKGFEVKVKKEKVKGHTLVDALEKVVKPPKRQDKKAFRMPVSGVYKIKGVGDVVTGRVEQGKITTGDQAEVVFAPKMPIVVQPFDECKPLGRIAAMDSNSLIMLGKVTKVTYVDPK